MDEVKQAFSISEKKKSHALRLYKEAVSEVVRKDYIAMVEDAHVDLSALFGMKFVAELLDVGHRVIDARVYADSNIEFNYANLRHSEKDRFIALAKELVPDNERVDDKKLEHIASQMNFILTFTTPNHINREFILVA